MDEDCDWIVAVLFYSVAAVVGAGETAITILCALGERIKLALINSCLILIIRLYFNHVLRTALTAP